MEEENQSVGQELRLEGVLSAAPGFANKDFSLWVVPSEEAGTPEGESGTSSLC